MKRFISFILTLVICFSAFSLISFAEDAPTAPVYYGVQKQAAGENKQNLRFISLVNSLVGTSVGYEITVKYGENTSVYTYEETATSVVYSSIIANNKPVSASDLGAKAALMTVVIKGVPTNIGVIDFEVTPCVEQDGQIIRGESVDVRFNGENVEGNTGRFEDIDISVMSFNVLNVWTGTNTVEAKSAFERAYATMSMVCDEQLDFVCFQEFDINYRAYFDLIRTEDMFAEDSYVKSFNEKYAELSLTGETSDINGVKTIDKQSRIWNPIYYDKIKYKVVDRGVYDFVDWGLNSYESVNYKHEEADNNTSDSRSLVWGVFEHIETGERVIVTNTHFTPNINLYDENEVLIASYGAAERIAEAGFVVDKIDALYEEYQCSVVMCGDYNSSVGGSGCKNVLAAGYKDTWQMADSKVDSNGYHENCINRTGHSSSSDAPTGAYRDAIDHILSKTELDVKSYDIITDKTFANGDRVTCVLDLSDHCPVVMTFTITTEISEGGRLNIIVGDAEDVTADWVEE